MIVCISNVLNVNKYTLHSAISRVDNKTNICPACGIKEALMQFIKQQNAPRH